MWRPDRREDRSKEVQPHGELGDVRVVLHVRRARARRALVGDARCAVLHVMPQVFEEQPHHASLALRPHHHLMKTHPLSKYPEVSIY